MDKEARDVLGLKLGNKLQIRIMGASYNDLEFRSSFERISNSNSESCGIQADSNPQPRGQK